LYNLYKNQHFHFYKADMLGLIIFPSDSIFKELFFKARWFLSDYLSAVNLFLKMLSFQFPSRFSAEPRFEKWGFF